MTFQFANIYKGFLTVLVLTLIWFLFSMSPDVTLQISVACKIFLAILTLVYLFSVSPGVEG